MTDAEMIDAPDARQQLDRLRAIMHRLRAPGGCPWDAEQTHATLVPHPNAGGMAPESPPITMF